MCLYIIQNENVNRAHTSEHRVKDLRRPDRRTPMKVLVEKTFAFVELVWSSYVVDNKPDIRYNIHVHVPCNGSDSAYLSQTLSSDQLKKRRRRVPHRTLRMEKRWWMALLCLMRSQMMMTETLH